MKTPAQKAERARKISKWICIAAWAAAVVLGVTFGFRWHYHHWHLRLMPSLAGWTATAVVLAIFLELLYLTGNKDTTGNDDSGYGLAQVLIGHDNRFSTSKIIASLWTLYVAVVLPWLLFSGLAHGFTQAEVDQLFQGNFEQYLILLGGPFAALALAKGITVSKLNANTLQKTDGTPQPGQTVANDDGATDLYDSQYLLFNLVALAYAVVAFAAHHVMPEIPGPLLALTSSTAAVYVANKAATANPPSISAVIPPAARPGATVKVRGQNFMPTGSKTTVGDSTTDMSATLACVGHVIPLGIPVSDDTVTFVVPPDTTVGDTTLQITSSAGVATADAAFRVIDPSPVITGVSPPVRPGARVTIHGNGFEQSGAHMDPLISVDGVAVDGGQIVDDRSITVTLPEALVIQGTTATLAVTIAGYTSASVTVPASPTAV